VVKYINWLRTLRSVTALQCFANNISNIKLRVLKNSDERRFWIHGFWR